MTVVDWAAVRAEFPAASNWTYLDNAASSPLSARARAAGIAFLEDAEANGRTVPLWRESLERARDGFARLIGVKPETTAFIKNATEGINIAATGLGAQPGDNIVMCGDLEHPCNLTAWLRLRDQGVELRLVPPDRSAVPAEAVAAAIDDRTAAVAAATVTFTPGFRTDFGPIAEAARRHDALFVVDATQSAGVLATDIEAMGVDLLATSTYKYLMGAFGLGYLYVSDRWAERIAPTFLGTAGYADTGANPAAADFAYELAAGARKFESGVAHVQAAMVAASLEMLNDIGAEAIEARATGLAGDLARGLADQGWPVNFDPFGLGQTHLVTVGAISPGDLYAVSEPSLVALHEALTEARVVHSARRGALRFAFHLFNDGSDVAATLDVAASVRRAAA